MARCAISGGLNWTGAQAAHGDAVLGMAETAATAFMAAAFGAAGADSPMIESPDSGDGCPRIRTRPPVTHTLSLTGLRCPIVSLVPRGRYIDETLRPSSGALLTITCGRITWN